jgi:tetratricopeptide (TPR) repeat protein
MGQIIKFPVRASKFGYKPVRKRAKDGENPAQLQLFAQATAQILQLATGFSHFERAMLLDERGDVAAVEFYLKAIAEQDCVADAYCNLGIIESKRGSTAKAFDCFIRSLKENPRHFEAHFNLGNMYGDVNDLRLAQIHYEIAAEIDPAFPNLYFNLALVLSMNEELAAAISALTKYQELVSPEEGRKADELLENLKKSVAAAERSSAGVK